MNFGTNYTHKWKIQVFRCKSSGSLILTAHRCRNCDMFNKKTTESGSKVPQCDEEVVRGRWESQPHPPDERCGRLHDFEASKMVMKF